MKKEYILLLCIFNSLFISCKLTRETVSINDLEIPPGTVKIADNLFIDKTEISNLSYLEYLHWTTKVYGNDSPEYKNALPDTSVWNETGKNYFSFSKNYLRRHIYRNHPVVGISYDQAIQFSKWRSDRVMEFALIRKKIIKYNPDPVKDSAFTIDRYFSGNYYNIKPDTTFMFYPDYSLMDSLQYIYVYKYADSLNKIETKRSWKWHHDFDHAQCYCFEKLKDKNDTAKYGTNPTASSSWKYKPNKNLTIDHLKGNVRELTSKKGLVFGLSFKDSSVVADKLFFFNESGINCYTGFRNICQWKKYD